jgi:hypothetical protein
VICGASFSRCERLASISFALDSKLSRIKEWVFLGSALTSIHFTTSLEVICESG